MQIDGIRKGLSVEEVKEFANQFHEYLLIKYEKYKAGKYSTGVSLEQFKGHFKREMEASIGLKINTLLKYRNYLKAKDFDYIKYFGYTHKDAFDILLKQNMFQKFTGFVSQKLFGDKEEDNIPKNALRAIARLSDQEIEGIREGLSVEEVEEFARQYDRFTRDSETDSSGGEIKFSYEKTESIKDKINFLASLRKTLNDDTFLKKHDIFLKKEGLPNYIRKYYKDSLALKAKDLSDFKFFTSEHKKQFYKLTWKDGISPKVALQILVNFNRGQLIKYKKDLSVYAYELIQFDCQFDSYLNDVYLDLKKYRSNLVNYKEFAEGYAKEKEYSNQAKTSALHKYRNYLKAEDFDEIKNFSDKHLSVLNILASPGIFQEFTEFMKEFTPNILQEFTGFISQKLFGDKEEDNIPKDALLQLARLSDQQIEGVLRGLQVSEVVQFAIQYDRFISDSEKKMDPLKYKENKERSIKEKIDFLVGYYAIEHELEGRFITHEHKDENGKIITTFVTHNLNFQLYASDLSDFKNFTHDHRNAFYTLVKRFGEEPKIVLKKLVGCDQSKLREIAESERTCIIS